MSLADQVPGPGFLLAGAQPACCVETSAGRSQRRFGFEADAVQRTEAASASSASLTLIGVGSSELAPPGAASRTRTRRLPWWTRSDASSTRAPRPSRADASSTSGRNAGAGGGTARPSIRSLAPSVAQRITADFPKPPSPIANSVPPEPDRARSITSAMLASSPSRPTSGTDTML